MPAVVAALAGARPDALAVIDGPRRLRWRHLADQSRCFADALHRRGFGAHGDPAGVEPWRSTQDHVGLCLHNGAEFLVAMLGAFGARVAPFNINYRYVADELRYVLTDAAAGALVFHSGYAEAVAEAARAVGSVRLLAQVRDGSGAPLVPGAVWFDDLLAGADPAGPPVVSSPDDRYILYTGGTTGRPKGVLWRQADALVACFGVPRDATSLAEVTAAATAPIRLLPTPPFIHGAGQWVALRTLIGGGTVVVPEQPDRFDPAAVWRAVEHERVTSLAVVGDSFCVPLLAELDRRHYDASSLTVLLSGGAPLSARVVEALLQRLPTVLVVDGLGSSEVGGQVVRVASNGTAPGSFEANLVTTVLSDDLTRPLAPGEAEVGWLASAGRLALGYLDDPIATARTFPTVAGVRHGVPGDRASRRADGTIVVHGRDARTINTGGEKVFAEEVEEALRAHPAVDDCVVTAGPSERWGQEIVALVQFRPGRRPASAEVLAAAEARLARFKLPKRIVVVPAVRRSPAGKADLAWARAVAGAADAGVTGAAGGSGERGERVEVEGVLEMP